MRRPRDTTDLRGMRFTRLMVIDSFLDKSGRPIWRCVCDCGKTVESHFYYLRVGRTKSCGCLRNENTLKRSTVHGMTHSRAHSIWRSMKTRCSNPKRQSYKDYGGRGIKVCERWMKFENFYADMGDPPVGKTLDRIDNDGNYEPSNCRWATHKEQASNRRNTRPIVFNGQKLTVTQWAKRLRLNRETVSYRLNKNGWDIGRIIRHYKKKPMEKDQAA